MDTGYVRLWRCSFDSQVFRSESLWRVWTWCLMKATYKERWQTVTTGKGETQVLLTPGQFIFGRKSAANELNYCLSSIRNRMKKLEKLGNIEIKADTHHSIVTVCNWEKYQADQKQDGQAGGQAEDNQRTTKGHKQKGKESKKEIYGEFQNVLLSVEEKEKLSELFPSSLEEKINNLSSYIASVGKKYSSHYATILAWERKNNPSGKKDDGF